MSDPLCARLGQRIGARLLIGFCVAKTKKSHPVERRFADGHLALLHRSSNALCHLGGRAVYFLPRNGSQKVGPRRVVNLRVRDCKSACR